MSKFLSNLAARSLGAFDTIAPRVPSRFEPTRRANGLLAGRAPSGEEDLREIREVEGTGSAETPAANSTEDRSRARRRGGLTGPMDLSLRQSDSTPSSSESDSGMRSIQPAASIAPRAESQETPLEPMEPVLRARRTPGSPSADSAPSDTAVVQPLDPASTPSSARAFTLSSAQRRQAKKGEMQGEGTQRVGPARSQAAQLSTLSSPGAQDSDLGALGPDLIVSGSVRTPGQMDDSPSMAGSMPTSQRAMDRGKTVARNRERRNEIPNASFPAMPASAEPVRPSALFGDESGTESGPAAGAGRRWSGDALDRRLGLKPDRPLAPAPLEETATRATTLTTRAIGAEHGSSAARPAVQNLLPATQPPADTASEPAIRVTIGRVEVRAVFPDQAVKRTPPPRFRPRVSLDDYLSRGSGGRR
jgi:hypothetical protein